MERIVEALMRRGIHPDVAVAIARQWTIGMTVTQHLQRTSAAIAEAALEFGGAPATEQLREIAS
jgi:hypothetical protein